MGLVVKTAPVGIDLEIDRMQKTFYNSLISTGWINYQAYPRAYINDKEKGSIPEIYTGKNEYQECLMDDSFNATSFFLTGNDFKFNEGAKLVVDVSLIFQADIKKLYPAILHRADEEMHADVFRAVYNTKYAMFLNSITTGIENVYSDLKIPTEYLDRVKLDDMSNYHVIKVNFSIPFNHKIC